MRNAIRPPWHLRVVAIVSLLWNGLGAVDYTMTRTRNFAYLSYAGDPSTVLAWIDRMPGWVQVAWPLGVWGGVLGSILLLARSRVAVWAFLLSLIGAVAVAAYERAAPATEFTQGRSHVLPLVICLIAALLLLYSRRMVARGVLG